MSTYKNGERTKKQLIEYVYAELLSNPVSSLKIRDVAKKSGCAPSSIYQHFSSLDELIAVASVKFLDEYTFAYSKMLNEDYRNKKMDPAGRCVHIFRNHGDRVSISVYSAAAVRNAGEGVWEGKRGHRMTRIGTVPGTFVFRHVLFDR